jgi:lipopolysaccharide/colanic/teichoic acid biosynthesis glycosyltransferase
MISGTELAPRPVFHPDNNESWKEGHDSEYHHALFGMYAGLKPAVDCLLAAVLLVLLAPLMLIAALAVRLTSRGPVFYSQVRVGLGGRLFHILKLRTMIHNCEAASGARWAVPGDSRVTPVGRVLRATHLDELPQLFNVLRGDMSLVGPRPERPEFIPGLAQAIPHYRERLLVRPGVTGLAQVQLPPDTDLNSVRRKLACDLYYIRCMGLWLDLRIILCTAWKSLGIPFVLSGNLLGIPSQRRHRTMLALQAQLAS